MNSWKELVCAVLAAAALLVVGAAQIQRGSTEWKRRQCVGNLKTIQQGAAMYQNDHDGAFQPVIVQSKPRWIFWTAFVRPYVKNANAFYCHENPKAQNVLKKDDGEDDLLPPVFDIASVCYGMNYGLSSSGNSEKTPPPYNIRAIADPAYTIYFGDGKTLSLRPTKYCWKDDYAPYHEGESNFIFLDGHVEAMNEKNLGLVHAFDGWKKDVKRWINWK